MAEKSGFHYLGIGCLIAGVLLVLGLGSCGFLAYRWGKGLEADLKDPEGRRDRVLQVLRGDELPEGYHGMVGLRIPMLLETAILSDQELGADEEFQDLGERGLLYFAVRNFGRDREELDDFFSGRTADPEVLEKHDINMDLGERLGNGRIERPLGPVLWVTHRGDLSSAQTRGRHEGLITLFQVQCPDDSYNRLGMWFGPEPADDGGEEALAGTVADPVGIERFVAHFRFCPD